MKTVKLAYHSGNYGALVDNVVLLCLEEDDLPEAKESMRYMLGAPEAACIEHDNLFELINAISKRSGIPVSTIDSSFQDLEERLIPGTTELQAGKTTLPETTATAYERSSYSYPKYSYPSYHYPTYYEYKTIEAQRFDSPVTYDLLVSLDVARAVRTAFNSVGENEVMLIGDSEFKDGCFNLKYVFIPTQEVSPGSTDALDTGERLPPDMEFYSEGAALIDYHEAGGNIRFFNTWIHLHPGGLSTTPSQKDKNTQLERLFGSGVHSPDHQIMIIGKETFPLGEVTAELWIRPVYPLKGMNGRSYIVHKLNLKLDLGQDEKIAQDVKKRVLTYRHNIYPGLTGISPWREISPDPLSPEPPTKRKKSK